MAEVTVEQVFNALSIKGKLKALNVATGTSADVLKENFLIWARAGAVPSYRDLLFDTQTKLSALLRDGMVLKKQGRSLNGKRG